MIEETGGSGATTFYDGDSYRVAHKGERFALNPTIRVESAESTSLAREERELAEALEQIRMMEQKQQLHVDTDTQLLEYLK